MKKKRKQRENPRPVGATSLPVTDSSQERSVKQRRDLAATISASLASSGNDILKVYVDLLILFSYSFLILFSSLLSCD